MRWISALLALAFLLSASAPSVDEKRISIYSTAANYSLPVAEREGRDYVGLLETLEPLGSVSARVEGGHWRLRYENVDAEFTPGKIRTRIRGKEFDLSANFLLENGRGLVPLASLTTLLPRFLGGPVTFHETGRRLFIGSVATQFTAELSKTPPKLVLNFSSPVNPMISTEPGKLRMVFSREPLVPPGTQTLAFGDKTIPNASFQENNGAAEITVTGTLPLMASFSNGGKTITIIASGAAPQPAATQATGAQTTAQPPAQTQGAVPAPTQGVASSSSLPVIGAISPVHRLMAVVDASHGGDERGAALTNQLPEKDVTLAVARRLRQELENRGVSVLMLRDSDATLGLDQRATLTNLVSPAIYICVHASSQGNGVRLYTGTLSGSTDTHGPFVPWDRAQAASLQLSEVVVGSVAAELRQKQVAVKSLEAPLRPLNNIVAPVLAVELAPPGKDVLDLASPAYEQVVAGAVANGVAQLRDKLEVKR